MGAYLYIGFVAKVAVKVEPDVLMDDFLKDIEHYYPADTFDAVEADRTVTFSLKPVVVEAELLPFVQQVYEDFYGTSSHKRLKEELEFVQANKGEIDWIEKAKRAELRQFSPLGNELREIFILADKKFYIYPTVIILGSEGKFAMEDSDHTLRFMETCAQRAYGSLRLARTFRVFVF